MSKPEFEYEAMLNDFINIIKSYQSIRDAYKAKRKDYVAINMLKFARDIDKIIEFNNIVCDVIADFKAQITVLTAKVKMLGSDNSSLFDELINLEEAEDPIKNIQALNNHIKSTVAILKDAKKAN